MWDVLKGGGTRASRNRVFDHPAEKYKGKISAWMSMNVGGGYNGASGSRW